MTTIDDSLINDGSDDYPEDHPLHGRLNLHRFIFCAGCLIGTTIQAITICLVERGLSPKDYAINEFPIPFGKRVPDDMLEEMGFGKL